MSLCVYIDVSTHICLLSFHVSMQRSDAGREANLSQEPKPHFRLRAGDWSIAHRSFPGPAASIRIQSPTARQELLLLLAYEPC